MPKHAVLVHDLHAQQAAYLRAQYKMSQEEIGQLLDGLSQSQVSRLLKRAEDLKCFEEHVTYRFHRTPDISDERMELIRAVMAPKHAIDRLRTLPSATAVHVRHLCVFDSGSDLDTPEALQQRLRRFGRLAAGRIAELLPRAQRFGITWGETVGRTVEGLAALRPPQSTTPIQFVPVCAEPLEPHTTEFASSRLADRLNTIINDGRGERFSLSGVPAFIPRRFQQQQAMTIRAFLEASASYRRIFRDKDPLVDHIDALLSSIGPNTRAVGFCRQELLQAGKITEQQLQAIVAGDLGGILIAKPPVPRARRSQEKLVSALNKMWTGMRLDQIARIAKQAARNPQHPGVIVVALGRNKATALAEILRCGLVNELIIDKDLLDVLLAELDNIER